MRRAICLAPSELVFLKRKSAAALLFLCFLFFLFLFFALAFELLLNFQHGGLTAKGKLFAVSGVYGLAVQQRWLEIILSESIDCALVDHSVEPAKHSHVRHFAFGRDYA